MPERSRDNASLQGYFVLVDGLASHSPRPPESFSESWLGTISEKVFSASFGAEVRQLSYYRNGYQYDGQDTDVSILASAQDILRSYSPRLEAPHTMRISYIAFSLGGVVTLLGLAALARNWGEDVVRSVDRVILIQPAFVVRRGVAKIIREQMRLRSDHLRVVPTPIAELCALDTSGEIFDEVVRSVTELRELGIGVDVVCWLRDGFVTYPRILRKYFLGAGAQVHVIQPASDMTEAKTAFEKHMMIARDDNALLLVSSLVGESRVP